MSTVDVIQKNVASFNSISSIHPGIKSTNLVNVSIVGYTQSKFVAREFCTVIAIHDSTRPPGYEPKKPGRHAQARQGWFPGSARMVSVQQYEITKTI